MLTVDTPHDLKAHVGRELEPSDWVTVDQAMIDTFADATGDHQWIHVDTERAAREMPGGATIAHGYLTLALLPRMIEQCYDIAKRRQSINYGSNRVRFTAPVPAGSRVRLKMTFRSVTDTAEGGVRIVSDCLMELEGADRPALIAEVISVAYP